MNIDFDLYNIDLNRLEEEDVEQPKRLLVWSDKLQRSQAKLRRLKIKLEEVRASISLKIIKDPVSYGFKEKPVPTATAIGYAVILKKRFKKAQEQYLKEKERMDYLQIMVTALDDRKRAIEGAIKLHGQQYFSKPWRPFKGEKHKRKVGKE